MQSRPYDRPYRVRFVRAISTNDETVIERRVYAANEHDARDRFKRLDRFATWTIVSCTPEAVR